jgi:hypothetical protein
MVIYQYAKIIRAKIVFGESQQAASVQAASGESPHVASVRVVRHYMAPVLLSASYFILFNGFYLFF